jgi:hypothetical protein
MLVVLIMMMLTLLVTLMLSVKSITRLLYPWMWINASNLEPGWR